MGIPKLTTFVEKCGHYEMINFTSREIVIDGSSLCYFLYAGLVNSSYCEFYAKVQEYFQSLQSRGIKVYVIIDGVDPQNRKIRTAEERSKARIKNMFDVRSQIEKLPPHKAAVLPLFAKAVFVDAMRDMGSVKYFVADGEADQAVVSLANHLRCPVLGRDSDYYIFNIEGGYIPLSDSTVCLCGEVQCFNYRTFDHVLLLRSPRLRLFLPYCLSNDFHGPNPIPKLGIDLDSSVDTVISKIKSVDFNDYSKDLEDDCKFYEVAPISFEELSKSRSLCRFSPEWIVDLYKSGLFMPSSMNFLANHDKKVWRYSVVIEDVSQSSAWEVTKSVRSFIIGALLSHENNSAVPRVQIVRKECRLIEETIEIAEKHIPLFSLKDVPLIQEEDRKKIIMRVFHCKSASEIIDTLPPELKLVVIASRCWLRNIASDPYVNSKFKAFILALVYCFHECLPAPELASEPEPAPEPAPEPVPERPTESQRMGRLRRIHFLAKWQCMLHHVIAFNQILNHPFPYVSPGRLFSSTCFDRYYCQDLASAMDELQKKMFHAITKDILDESAQPKGNESHSLHSESHLFVIPTQNRFASLPTDVSD